MYPSWRYHATDAPRLIHSSAEEQPGWSDSPAAHGREGFVNQKVPGDVQLTAARVVDAPAPAPRPRAAAKSKKRA